MIRALLVAALAIAGCAPSASAPPSSAPTAFASAPASTIAPTAVPASVALTVPPVSTAAPSTSPLGTTSAAPLATVTPTATTAPPPTPTPAPTPVPTPDPTTIRALDDRPDDFAGPQIHYLYVLPSDGVDERLDVNGVIATSVASIQAWLAQQTAGRRLRVDTFQGRVDATFFRLTQTDAQIAASGSYVRDRIEAELRAAGVLKAGKLYAVFYGGGSTSSCGGGAWPPVLPGVVAAMYLKGTPPGSIPCAVNTVGASASSPGYMDFGLLHELLHTMGIVGSCAPHHTLAGHVSDDPRDLMYAGPLPWHPSILDVGHDDYFGHGIAGCPDLAKMPWLGP